MSDVTTSYVGLVFNPDDDNRIVGHAYCASDGDRTIVGMFDAELDGSLLWIGTKDDFADALEHRKRTGEWYSTEQRELNAATEDYLWALVHGIGGHHA